MITAGASPQLREERAQRIGMRLGTPPEWAEGADLSPRGAVKTVCGSVPGA